MDTINIFGITIRIKIWLLHMADGYFSFDFIFNKPAVMKINIPVVPVKLDAFPECSSSAARLWSVKLNRSGDLLFGPRLISGGNDSC